MKYEIGARIRELREKSNVNQKEFAKLIGVSNSRVSNWEQGINRPDVDILSSICDVLSVSADELLGTKTGDTKDLNRSKRETALLSDFNKLNDIGQHEASKRIEELTYIDKYKKEIDYFILNAAHQIDGASEEDLKHDDDIMDDPNF